MYTYDVAIDENWNNSYTANRYQQSDDGALIYVSGIRGGSYKNFNSTKDMFAWCYANGWTEPTEI